MLSGGDAFDAPGHVGGVQADGVDQHLAGQLHRLVAADLQGEAAGSCGAA